MTVLATACSSDDGNGSGNGSGNGGDEQVTIEWGFWAQSDAANERWGRLADKVTEEYPNITVTRTSPPFADYFTRLQAQLASNTVPCVVSMQSLRLPAFVDVMEPLEDLMAAEGFNEEEWNPAGLAALQVDGTQYAIPYGISTMLMYYDMDAFEEAGVPFPEADWTIADFEAAAEQITEATGKPAFGQSFSDLHMFSFLQAYNGAVPVTEDGELDLTSDAMREAFTWYSGLSTEQQVALTPASSSEIPWGEQQLVNGNTAMAVDGSWNLAPNAIDASFRLGVTTIPVGEGGISSFSANSGFGISRTCEHKEEAAKVIAVLTSEEAQAETAESGTQPARAGIDDIFFEGLEAAARPGSFRPDLVMSGINLGMNTGRSLLHSGTMGAALATASRGIRSMAVSITGSEPQHWETARLVVDRALEWATAHDFGDRVLNINVPDIPPDRLRGIRPAALASFGAVQARVARQGAGHIRFTLADAETWEEEGTDHYLLARGWSPWTLVRGPVTDMAGFELPAIDLADDSGVRVNLTMGTVMSAGDRGLAADRTG